MTEQQKARIVERAIECESSLRYQQASSVAAYAHGEAARMASAEAFRIAQEAR